MLVLERSAGESIVIGDDILVTVLKIEGGRVKIGVAAPREIVVDRIEISEVRNAAKRMLE